LIAYFVFFIEFSVKYFKCWCFLAKYLYLLHITRTVSWNLAFHGYLFRAEGWKQWQAICNVLTYCNTR